MPDLIRCPFYRKEYEETIRCEMCSKWFPGRDKTVGWWKRYCISNWESCPNAVAITDIYEEEGEMFQIRKLQFELNRSREEVKQMSKFIKTKKEQNKELMKINEAMVTRIARLEALQKINPELTDRQKMQEILDNQRMENRALYNQLHNIENNLTAMCSYLAFKTGHTKINIKDYINFSQAFEVGFEYPEDYAEKVEKGTLTSEDEIEFRYNPIEVEEVGE
jgi:hypothetical protein